MTTIDQHLDRAKQEIARSQKTSSTEAGQTSAGAKFREDLIDPINQVFSVFRINYHNQFYSAFTDDEKLNSAKKLWLQSLSPFEAETLLRAANTLVGSSEYLPTLSKFVSTCDEIQFALPSARDAYLEACRAGSNLQSHKWSHAVVYHAGKACGWYLLRNNPESQSWPIFRARYAEQCERIREGDMLALPQAVASEPEAGTVLDTESQKKRLAELKATLS